MLFPGVTLLAAAAFGAAAEVFFFFFFVGASSVVSCSCDFFFFNEALVAGAPRVEFFAKDLSSLICARRASVDFFTDLLISDSICAAGTVGSSSSAKAVVAVVLPVIRPVANWVTVADTALAFSDSMKASIGSIKSFRQWVMNCSRKILVVVQSFSMSSDEAVKGKPVTSVYKAASSSALRLWV